MRNRATLTVFACAAGVLAVGVFAGAWLAAERPCAVIGDAYGRV